MDQLHFSKRGDCRGLTRPNGLPFAAGHIKQALASLTSCLLLRISPLTPLPGGAVSAALNFTLLLPSTISAGRIQVRELVSVSLRLRVGSCIVVMLNQSLTTTLAARVL